MNIKQRKIKIEPGIKLNYNIYMKLAPNQIKVRLRSDMVFLLHVHVR